MSGFGPITPLPLGGLPPRPVVTLSAHVADKNDPHETRKLIPMVYAGTTLPTVTSTYKVGDIFIDRDDGKVYRLESGAWVLLELGGSVKPLSGETIPLDNENDLYDAVQKLLEKLGATVQ